MSPWHFLRTQNWPLLRRFLSPCASKRCLPIDEYLCLEGLGTSFITGMRSVGRVRAGGFLIRPCLLSRTRFSVVCPLNKFKA